jgi:hypothetical protein
MRVMGGRGGDGAAAFMQTVQLERATHSLERICVSTRVRPRTIKYRKMSRARPDRVAADRRIG